MPGLFRLFCIVKLLKLASPWIIISELTLTVLLKYDLEKILNIFESWLSIKLTLPPI